MTRRDPMQTDPEFVKEARKHFEKRNG